jgi:hypothetical protein
MKIGFVYKLVCKDVNAPEVYVGSGTSLRNRRTCHKSKCNNEKDKAYNLPVYQYIRDNGGWANWELLPIERVEFEFKFELHDRERHHMEAIHATLNSLVPNRTQAEYYQDHKNEIQQKKKQYYQDHTQEIKQYRQDHKQEIKQYYQDHKQEINQKHDCPCGGKYTHHHKTKHLKTECHQNYELGKQIYINKFGHA